MSRRIRLSDERRIELVRRLVAFHAEEFDEQLSEFRAEALLDFAMETLGPAVYNQAVQDARAYMQEKIDDLDVEFRV